MSKKTTALKATKAIAVAPQQMIWQEQNALTEIKKIYGKDLTEGEFTTLCQIGQATGLNPFLREIWAVKYGNNPASIFIGRDGYRKAAQANPEYDYHLVDAVYANDDFCIEEAEVKHNYSVKDRGQLAGAYCIVKRKSSSKPLFTFVEIREYNTGRSVWKEKPATMIKKVAEAQGLRMSFQSMFAGTYDENEQWEEEGKMVRGNAGTEEIQDKQALPQPKPVKKITPKTGEQLFAVWDELWELSLEKFPDEMNGDGQPKYSKKKSEATRKLTLKKHYNKESSTELTEAEGKDFVKRCKERVKELKKLPTPEKVEEQTDAKAMPKTRKPAMAAT
jgi:phage recombination protein Bet